ncbi:MAG: dTDP-4-dehydrorhamnose 3,5-epimerase [Candidatus Hodarchaeota archaeon]
MKFLETKLKDLYIIKPEPFEDNRGKFYRVFCKDELIEINHNKEIVNINISITKEKGAIRGMHFQYPPKSEIKIVTCIAGSVFDVAIDLRKNSSTFLQWLGEILSADNMKLLYIPEGFAHGFQVLEENSKIIYFVSEFYSPEHEGGIRYNDPKVNIEWPLEVKTISDKDRNLPLLDVNFKGI